MSCTVSPVTGDVLNVNVALLVTPLAVAASMSQPVTLAVVVNAKVPLAEPAAILTEAGNCRPAFEDFKIAVTTAVAGLLSRTVHVPEPPGFMVAGAHVKDVRIGGNSETVVWPLLDPYEAEMVAVRAVATEPVPTVNVAAVAFAGIEIDAGSVRTLAIAPERVTAAPPALAGLLKVTVQTVLALDARVARHCRDEIRMGAVSEREAV